MDREPLDRDPPGVMSEANSGRPFRRVLPGQSNPLDSRESPDKSNSHIFHSFDCERPKPMDMIPSTWTETLLDRYPLKRFFLDRVLFSLFYRDPPGLEDSFSSIQNTTTSWTETP